MHAARKRSAQRLLAITLAGALLWVGGCASMQSHRLANTLASAMLNQDDPGTVRAGAPAYLLLLDGLIEDAPEDSTLLQAGAKLYNAYATGLIEENSRARRLTARSLGYARRAICLHYEAFCSHEPIAYPEFTQRVEKVTPEHADLLYTYASSWAGWIQTRHSDWSALADLPKVEYMLQQVISNHPDHARGRAQLYLAVMRSQLSPALGGDPETGRHHFELAIRYSNGEDLMAKVEYARHYARLTYNQALHDRLLNEVIATRPEAQDLTLSNTIAIRKARQLLADDFF